MVGTDPAVTDSPKRQLRDEDVHRQVVDDDTAGACFAQHPPHHRFRTGEKIQGERLRPCVDKSDRLVEGADRQNGQNRPEYLLGHQLRGRVRIEHDRRLDGDRAGIAAAADHDLPAVPVEHAAQPVELPCVHDPLHGLVPFEPFQRGPDPGNELVPDRAVDENVVGGDTGLAGVQQLHRDDPLGGDVQVGVWHDDDRALAAQLQGHRGEVPRRGLHHLLTGLCSAGEEDVVEPLRHQLPGDGGIPLAHGDRVRVQVLRQQAGEQRGGRRRVLGRLDHDGVARGERPDERGQRQVDRVVPRADDKHHAQRFVLVETPVRQHVHRQRRPPWAHPSPQVPAGVGGFGAGAGDVPEPGIVGVTPEVGAERGDNVVLPLGEQAFDRAELPQPPCDIAGAARRERPAQPLDRRGGIGPGLRNRSRRDHGHARPRLSCPVGPRPRCPLSVPVGDTPQ